MATPAIVCVRVHGTMHGTARFNLQWFETLLLFYCTGIINS
jgi:hypothetical protein